MVPAAILVIIVLILVIGKMIYDTVKNTLQDERLDAHEEAIETIARHLRMEAPIITPPPSRKNE
jgi:hypothetical protein